MTCKVAFIGLGVMGYPMAGYISKAGHNVTVFNRTTSKADKWIKEYKGTKADTPAKAAENADYILTCVGNDNDLREVTFGDNGIFKTIKKGAVYIDNTTASATIAREIYDHAKKNEFGFLTYPLSGGYRSWSLLPIFLYPMFYRVEKYLETFLSSFMGFRMLVVLEKIK